MTDRHESQLMLPGHAPAPTGPWPPTTPAPPPPTRRTVRHLIWFTLAAVRTQPILSLVLFVGTLLVGLTLWATASPAWRVSCEMMVPNQAMSSSSLVDVRAGDLVPLMTSVGIRNEVSLNIADQIEPLGNGGLPSGYTESVVLSRMRDVGLLIRDGVANLGQRLGLLSSESDDSTDANLFALDVKVRESREARNIIGLDIWANRPEAAELAGPELADVVAEHLTRISHERAKRRLDKQTPLLDSAAASLPEAKSALETCQIEVGKQDPAAYAKQIESRLAEVQSELADLHTEKAEINAQRQGNLTRMREHQPEHTGEVVTTENPRIQALKQQISDLESEYAALTVRLKPKHPEMLKKQIEIESKKRELEREQQIVIKETVTSTNPIFENLMQTQVKLDQRLNQMAGREIGLYETSQQVSDDLASATASVRRLDELTRDYEAALATWTRLDQESRQLRSVLNDTTLYSDLTLTQTPRVNDPGRPDSPIPRAYLMVTLASAIFIMLLVPAARATIRARLVSDWQVEELTKVLPVRIAGELPAVSRRRLLRPARGRIS